MVINWSKLWSPTPACLLTTTIAWGCCGWLLTSSRWCQTFSFLIGPRILCHNFIQSELSVTCSHAFSRHGLRWLHIFSLHCDWFISCIFNVTLLQKLKVMLDLRVCGTLLYTEAALEEPQEWENKGNCKTFMLTAEEASQNWPTNTEKCQHIDTKWQQGKRWEQRKRWKRQGWVRH